MAACCTYGMCDARMKRKIIYLGHYNDRLVTGEERRTSRAAVTKMDYISDVVCRLGFEADIISPAAPGGAAPAPGGYYDLDRGKRLRLWRAFPRRGKMAGFLNLVLLRRRTKRLLDSLGPQDTVLCYHSLDFCKVLPRARARAGFRLILEVEELYSDVTGSPRDRRLEEACFKVADAFVFPTDLLADRVGLRGRPYCLCSGTYRMAPKVSGKIKDGLTHVVYAGTLDPRKGGAAAAAAGALLDAGFVMHVLGSGSEREVSLVKAAVREANETGRGCRVVYEGFKSGSEFDEFVQSCHIGLSPQNPDAAFNSTSFPSKVFMYLSNGLEVVSVDLPVFTSEMRDMIYTVPNNSPESLSEGIYKAREDLRNPRDPSACIGALDEDFKANLERLLAGQAGDARY